jgi:hypothetical protein
MPQALSSLLVRALITIVIDLMSAPLPVTVGGLSHRVIVFLPKRVGGTLDEVQFPRTSN